MIDWNSFDRHWRRMLGEDQCNCRLNLSKSCSRWPSPRVAIENPHDAVADTPFGEGKDDAFDADLRHRVISERAYARYRGRRLRPG